MKNERLKKEKNVNIYYGDEKGDYIRDYINETNVISGYLSEAKAFDIFFTDMIMCNNYLNNNYDNLDILVDGYNEKDDCYCEEFQIFLVNLEYSEDVTIKAVKKMGNTLYYDNKNDLYILGVTDLGTNRNLIQTDLKVEEEKKEYER